MKISLLSIMSFYLMKNFKFQIFILPFILMSLLFKMYNNSMLIPNQFSSLDQLSIILIILSLMSVLLIILSSDNYSKIYIYLIPILFILIITFSMTNMFSFYIMFELVLIPTMLLIMSSGAQPERLQAGIYLIMYTVLASLPLLISIFILKNNMSFNLIHISLLKFKLILFLMLAFLVKMPMFFSHLWLPKAHVEAPLEGSMILAAVLLKLGGYGLLRIMPLCISKISSMNFWIISVSILGASATGLNCIRQKDLKSLIAYSSVAHMGLVITSIFTMNLIGMSGAIFMMIAHGMSSSALFLLVNDLYTKLHSRNILIFKGLITIIPNITFWWFMFMAMNISAPPSINTMSEILIMSSLILWNKSLIIPIILASFTTASFSLSLFINISHNKNIFMPFSQSKQKIFLSFFLHITPLIFLLTKMEMFLLL